VTLNTIIPFGGNLIIHALVRICINQHMTFEVPSFTECKDIIGAKFKKTGHVTLATPIKG